MAAERVPTPGPTAALRTGVLGQFRRADPVTRLLVLSQLAFNVGFYMVLPYLAVHLADDLGLAAGTVGLVLGLRTFSQQGLFVVGGLLADRFGTKPVVLAGCVVRIAGFLGLAAAGSAVAAVLATVAVGFAAALFSPAVEAALARTGQPTTRADGDLSAERSTGDRVDRFALFSVLGQIGAFTGPLLGALLLFTDFRLACLAGAGVFALVLLAHVRWLPVALAAHAGEPVLAGWREVLGNRRFMIFALAYSGQLVAYNQVYQLLPQEVERAWGSQTPLSWLLAASSLLVVAGQLPLVRRLQDAPVRAVLPGGFVLLTAGFLVVALASPLRTTGAAGLLPAAAFVVLLTLGEMVVLPFVRALVPDLAAERRLGAYYGVLASVGGVAVLAGSTAIGAVIQLTVDRSGAIAAALPWLVAASIPTVGAVALLRLFPADRTDRTGSAA